MQNSNTNYKKFALMMAVSFVIMYAVMFLNIDQFSHLYLSTTRTYMTILMIAPMAISMMLFMWGMYDNKKWNMAIIGGAAVVFFITLFLLRTQEPIGDEQWMKAMIPHHSSAILTSQEAEFEHPEVQKLADEIIKAQVREIDEMKRLLREIE